MSIFEKPFWKDTAERVVSSAAQGALVGWGATVVFPSVDAVIQAGEAAAFGALGLGVATFFKCLIASRVGDKDEPTPSFVDLGQGG